MSNVQFFATGLRLLGVYLLLTHSMAFISASYYLLLANRNSDQQLENMAIILPSVFLIAFSLLAVIWPTKIVKIACPGALSDTDEPKQPLDFEDLGFRLLGVFLLVYFATGTQELFSIITGYTLLSQGAIGTFQFVFQYVVPVLIPLLVGIWCLLGAKGLRGFIRAMRRSNLANE